MPLNDEILDLLKGGTFILNDSGEIETQVPMQIIPVQTTCPGFNNDQLFLAQIDKGPHAGVMLVFCHLPEYFVFKVLGIY